MKTILAAALASTMILPPVAPHSWTPGADSIEGAPVLHESEDTKIHLPDEQPVYFKIDIPTGYRAHIGYTINPDNEAENPHLRAELVDEDGQLSSFAAMGTRNADTGEGLRSGYIRSLIMDPANRSWGKDTYVRFIPDGENFFVNLDVSLIPAVVDGGALEEVDRPSLRYADDLESVDIPDITETLSLDAGAVARIPVDIGWMQAFDASYRVVESDGSDGSVSLRLFNPIGEPMTLVGQYEIPVTSEEEALVGQRAPAHYKNVTAQNKTRNTGFLAGEHELAIMNTSSAPLTVDIDLAVRGEAIEPGPVFDAKLAEEAAMDVEPIDYIDMNESQPWYSRPLAWLAIGLFLVAGALIVVVAKRRS